MDWQDRLLVEQRLKRGDKQALHQVYERYKHSLVTLAGALLHDPGDAQDVVHDVFSHFIQQLGHFRLTGRLKAYLSTCVANRARNCNRRLKVQRNNAVSSPNIVAHGPDQQAILDEQATRVLQAMGQLPQEQREVVALRIYASLRFPVIARHQGVSVNTAEGRYRYGMAKLRQCLLEEVSL